MDLGASIRNLVLAAFAISSILMGGGATAHAQATRRNRTFWSSWAMTSVGSTSAPTIVE